MTLSDTKVHCSGLHCLSPTLPHIHFGPHDGE